MFSKGTSLFDFINEKESIEEKGTQSSANFSVWSVKITYYLNIRDPMITPMPFAFYLSWKDSWYQRIQSWKFKTLSWITNHDPLSQTLDNWCVFIIILTLNLSDSHTVIACIIGLSTFDIYSSVKCWWEIKKTWT